MQEVFHAKAKDTELVTKQNFKISEVIAQKGKAYGDGEFQLRVVWNCLPDMCFQKRNG